MQLKPVVKLNVADDSNKFQPLPAPTGSYPFRYNLPRNSIDGNRLVFHMVGDTGSTVNPLFLKNVAGKMRSHFNTEDKKNDPSFLYHLGDVVYNHGEEEHYYDQFFAGFNEYPKPIFAIPGNHDADPNPAGSSNISLKAFMEVFCNAENCESKLAQGLMRKCNTQPNSYFTLTTPLANIIGLYSNVPKFGIITSEQQDWFIEELISAGKEKSEKALIVCLHHSPYSGDTNHGSSLPMISFLENAFLKSGIKPHVVFSAHVHNYQRFIKTYNGGEQIPFIVAGAGGYAELHKIVEDTGTEFSDDSPLFAGVSLEKYCDNSHGFLKITITKDSDSFNLRGDYYTIGESDTPFDSFSVNF